MNNVVSEFVNNYLRIDDNILRNNVIASLNGVASTVLGKEFLHDLIQYSKDMPQIKIVNTAEGNCFRPLESSIHLNLNSERLNWFENTAGEWLAEKKSFSRSFLHELIHLFHYRVYGKGACSLRTVDDFTEWDNDEEKSTIEGLPSNSIGEKYTENNLSQEMGDDRKRVSHFSFNDANNYVLNLLFGFDGNMHNTDFNNIDIDRVVSAYTTMRLTNINQIKSPYMDKVVNHKIKALSILFQHISNEKKERIINSMVDLSKKGISGDKELVKIINGIKNKLVTAAQDLLNASNSL